MLGFASLEVALSFWLTLAASGVCVVYGVVNWNKGGNGAPPRTED